MINGMPCELDLCNWKGVKHLQDLLLFVDVAGCCSSHQEVSLLGFLPIFLLLVFFSCVSCLLLYIF